MCASGGALFWRAKCLRGKTKHHLPPPGVRGPFRGTMVLVLFIVRCAHCAVSTRLAFRALDLQLRRWRCSLRSCPAFPPTRGPTAARTSSQHFCYNSGLASETALQVCSLRVLRNLPGASIYLLGFASTSKRPQLLKMRHSGRLLYTPPPPQVESWIP